MSFKSKCLGFFIEWFVLLVTVEEGLAPLLELGDVERFLVLLVNAVMFGGVKLAGNIRAKVFLLEFLPSVSVELDRS